MHCSLAFVAASDETVCQKSTFTTSYLIPIVEHFSDCTDVNLLEKRSSPWEELPTSPETFQLINNYELCGETSHKNVSWQWDSIACDTVHDPALIASNVPHVSHVESSDIAAVPECELLSEDMLMDFDEAVSDVIMNSLTLADIGLFLPTVSADDVDSLLSSSVLATGPAAASLVGSDSTASCLPIYCDEIQPPSTLICDKQTLVTDVTDNLQVYQEQIQALSPWMSETEHSSVSEASPVYEDQVQVLSPASSQSSVTVMSGRRLRKKEQNKTAAQRYRQKKRGEQGQVMTEYEQLERRNIELRTRVEEMTREVDYLKGLIEEICA